MRLYGEAAFALSLLGPEDVGRPFPLVNSHDTYPYAAPDDLTDNRQ